MLHKTVNHYHANMLFQPKSIDFFFLFRHTAIQIATHNTCFMEKLEQNAYDVL